MSKGPIKRDVPINEGYQPLQKGYVPQPNRGHAPISPDKPQGGHVPTTSESPPGTPPNTGSGVKPPPKK